MSDGRDACEPESGHELLRILGALSSPHRLRIVAALSDDAVHVSGLARAVGLGRPLVHMHLKRLEAAGLVRGRLELSEDGKAMRFYEVVPFAIHLTPERIAEVARLLDSDETTSTHERKETP